jgi:hypothetical protein
MPSDRVALAEAVIASGAKQSSGNGVPSVLDCFVGDAASQ